MPEKQAAASKRPTLRHEIELLRDDLHNALVAHAPFDRVRAEPNVSEAICALGQTMLRIAETLESLAEPMQVILNYKREELL